MATSTTAHRLGQLVSEHGHAMVDEALRATFSREGPDQSLAHALFTHRAGSEAPFDFGRLHDKLEELKRVGKPWPPIPEAPGGVAIKAGRIGIQGNPVRFDNDFVSGWHFKQSNGWDSWFNIVSKPDGGYWVLTPASRLTGNGGPANVAPATTATMVGEQLEFDVSWPAYDGFAAAVGHFVLHFSNWDPLNGETWALNNPGVMATFEATRMPLTEAPPNIPPQTQYHPIISVTMTATTVQDGYNVRIGGVGFATNEPYTIEGRVVHPGVSAEWATYATGTADVLGHIDNPPEFSIVKPQGTTYVFRAHGVKSGYTPEQGA